MGLELAGRRAAGDQRAGAAAEVRLRTLRITLAELGFAPDITESGESLLIRLNNCPFRVVARADSAVCSFDASLIETALGVPIYRESSVADGALYCTYRTRGTEHPGSSAKGM